MAADDEIRGGGDMRRGDCWRVDEVSGSLSFKSPFELFRLLLCVVVGDRPREVRLVDAAVADGMFGD